MNGSLTSPLRLLIVLQGFILTIAALYFGQPVLMPFAVAVLLTFLLRPGVAWLQRRRVPRVAAVVLVAVGICLGLGGVIGIVGGQLYDLASHLNDYRGHLSAKIVQLKRTRTSAADNVRQVIDEVTKAIDDAPKPAVPEGESKNSGDEVDPASVEANERQDRAQDRAADRDADRDAETARRLDEPQIVRLAPETAAPAAALRAVWEVLSTPLGTTAVVSVLTIFMLLSFEDMRNRLLRLSGPTKLTLTTKTLDDVGKRISKYLAMNALVNGAFGLFVFAGLYCLGVDYAALWGFMAATLRFVPYVGPIAAAVMPIAMSIVQFPDWLHPAGTLAVFLVLELITNNVIEPMAYGKSAGVSTVALLVSATFWAWIWGPMGLVLSVPLTVVLAVLGKHIPQLETLHILLGDEPALAPFASFYQRLLADDEEEAAEILEEQLAAGDRAEVYDSLLIPALALSERDRHDGALTDRDMARLWETARELVESNAPAESNEPSVARKLRIAACPAQDMADELASAMLAHVVPAHVAIELLSAAAMASEKVASLDEFECDAAIVSAVGPGGASHVRYLCKRIRERHPELKIVVARWGFKGDRAKMSAGISARGADFVVTTLAETLEVIQRLPPVAAEPVVSDETVAAR